MARLACEVTACRSPYMGGLLGQGESGPASPLGPVPAGMGRPAVLHWRRWGNSTGRSSLLLCPSYLAFMCVSETMIRP